MSYPLMNLGEVISLVGGGTPSKDIEKYWGDEIPWATVKDLKTPILDKTIDSITKLGLDNSASKVVKSGSIIIATRMAVGRVVIAGSDVAINQDLKGIACSNKIDTKYLYYFLSSQEHYFNRVSSGATVKGIKIAHITDINIPLPPLPEQQKIAAILDAADQLRQKYQQLIDHYTTLSQSLFLEMFGDPVTNPKGWDMSRIDMLCSIVRGSSPRPKGDPRYYGGKIPRLMVADLTRDGKTVTPIIDSLTEEGAKKSRPTKAGTVVMAVSGNVGLTSILSVDACIHDGFIAFNQLNTDAIMPYFFVDLMMFLKSTHASRQAGAIFKNLTTSQIKEMKIPLPPLNVQNDFCGKITAIEQQKQQAQASLAQSEALFNSLLQRAFKGELTGSRAA